MKTVAILVAITALLSGCAELVPPAEQVQMMSSQSKHFGNGAVRTTVVNDAVDVYHCDKGLSVKLQQTQPEKKRKSPLTVTFGELSYKLSPTITKNGYKYSNIRWIWWEKFDGKASLFDNSNHVLAKNCVKQN